MCVFVLILLDLFALKTCASNNKDVMCSDFNPHM